MCLIFASHFIVVPEVQPVMDNSGSAANKPFYSLDYYTQFFDVDTVQVI